MNDTTPPPAPDMRGEDGQSWPRRHPVLTGIAGFAALLVLGSALGGDGESTSDPQEATAQSEASEPVEQVTVTAEPEPAETVTVTSAPEPSEAPTPSPDPEPTETTAEGGEEPQEDTPPAPEAEPDPVSAYVDGEYDAELEALAEACVDGGDGDACWDLFMDSPVDSEYEALGLDGSGPLGDNAGDVGDIDAGLILPILWEGMSQDERDLICLGWSLDEGSSLDSFMDGADDIITRDEAKDFFDDEC